MNRNRVKSSFFLALGGCVLSPFLVSASTWAEGVKTGPEIAAQIVALGELADEYAATGKADSLQVSLEKLSLLREEWESVGRPVADVISVAETKDQERAAIENLFVDPDDEPVVPTANKPKGYEREFNGTTLKPKEVVITFDDGPHPVLTPQVHAFVKSLNIPAAFFEIGENVKAHPEITRALASEGYIIGDHSWDHPQLTKLTDMAVAKEINDTQSEIQTVLGGPDSFNLYFQTFFEKFFAQPNTVYAPEFFRSPYGARSARTMNIISNTVVGGENDLVLGKPQLRVDEMFHVLWNVDSLDWQDKNPVSIENRVMNQLATYGHRGVILFHDIHPQTTAAIHSILPRLIREGYKLVSLYDMVEETLPTDEKKINSP